MGILTCFRSFWPLVYGWMCDSPGHWCMDGCVTHARCAERRGEWDARDHNGRWNTRRRDRASTEPGGERLICTLCLQPWLGWVTGLVQVYHTTSLQQHYGMISLHGRCELSWAAWGMKGDLRMRPECGLMFPGLKRRCVYPSVLKSRFLLT